MNSEALKYAILYLSGMRDALEFIKTEDYDPEFSNVLLVAIDAMKELKELKYETKTENEESA